MGVKNKRQKNEKIKTIRIAFLRIVVEHSMMNNIRSEDIEEELGIIGINTIIKTAERKGKRIRN